MAASDQRADEILDPSVLIPPAESWPKNSFMVTFAFSCNIACQFCMVEDALNVIPGTSLEAFKRALEGNINLDGISRIIFSGGEVTLSKQLPAYAEFARSLPGIQHVRIQTNATRLGDRARLRELMAAGIDEFFVSFHAPDQQLYDDIAQKRGAFKEILAGLEAIVEEGGSLSTNTAVVMSNHNKLEEIVERLLPFHPLSMEFWNYWPRADEDAGRRMAAPVNQVQRYLVAAMEKAIKNGIPPVVKWFPRCLLGPWAKYLDDSQPKALIDDSYWAREPAYSCIYEGICSDSGAGCSGLSHSYIEQYGWEEKILTPNRLYQPEKGNINQQRIETRSLVKDAGDKRSNSAAITAWLTQYELSLNAEYHGFLLARATMSQGTAVLALHFSKGESKFEIRVSPKDLRRPAFVRTASYNISYSQASGELSLAAQQLARALAQQLSQHDSGEHRLPG